MHARRGAHLDGDLTDSVQSEVAICGVCGTAGALVQVEVQQLSRQDEVLTPVEEVAQAHDALHVLRVGLVHHLQQLDLQHAGVSARVVMRAGVSAVAYRPPHCRDCSSAPEAEHGRRV